MEIRWYEKGTLSFPAARSFCFFAGNTCADAISITTPKSNKKQINQIIKSDCTQFQRKRLRIKQMELNPTFESSTPIIKPRRGMQFENGAIRLADREMDLATGGEIGALSMRLKLALSHSFVVLHLCFHFKLNFAIFCLFQFYFPIFVENTLLL